MYKACPVLLHFGVGYRDFFLFCFYNNINNNNNNNNNNNTNNNELIALESLI